MVDEKTTTNRRTVLKTISAAGLSASGLGTVKGSKDSESSDTDFGRDNNHIIENTMSISSETRVPKNEWTRVEQKKDNKAPVGTPDKSVQEHLDVHGHWENDGNEVWTNDCYRSNVEIYTDTVCTVYNVSDDEGNIVTDREGDYRFIVELWAHHEVTDEGGFFCPGVNVEKAKQRLYTTNDKTEFIDRDPKTTDKLNDERLTVKQGGEIMVGGNGLSYTRSDMIRVNDGRYGATIPVDGSPDSFSRGQKPADSINSYVDRYRWSPGTSAEYTLKWETTDSSRGGKKPGKDQVDLLGLVEIASETDGQFKDDTDSGFAMELGLRGC